MIYLLDTNICIYIIKQRPIAVRQKFMAYQIGDIGVSSITIAELQVGVERNQQRNQAALALEQLLQSLLVLNFDLRAAAAYGKLRTHLESRGTPIGPLDSLIAAHAISLDATLVTNKLREFARVPGLKAENWVGE